MSSRHPHESHQIVVYRTNSEYEIPWKNSYQHLLPQYAFNRWHMNPSMNHNESVNQQTNICYRNDQNHWNNQGKIPN